MQVNELFRTASANFEEGEETPLAILAVALPYYLVRFTAICVERKSLGVLHEYLLRGIHVGFNQTVDIAAFLGVKEELTRRHIDSLADELYIAFDTKADKSRLLEKGLRAITGTGLTKVVIRESACYLQGATRKVDLSPGELHPRRDFSSDALILPPIPSRPPFVEELDLPSVKAWMNSARSAQLQSFEVAKLGRVIRSASLFKSGYLLLRRGQHSLPQICTDGSADLLLAQKYGPHPALLQVKQAIDRHEQLVRRSLILHRPNLKGANVLPAHVVRAGLATCVSLSDSDGSKTVLAEKLFLRSTDSLIHSPAWVGLTESQVLFARAIVSASKEIIVVAPRLSQPLLDGTAFEQLSMALRRGVRVVLYTHASDERFQQGSELLEKVLKGAAVVQMPVTSEWCGFGCDDEFAVVGKAKTSTTSMGQIESFFGAVVLRGQQPSLLLQEVAINSGVAVTVKAKRRTPLAPKAK